MKRGVSNFLIAAIFALLIGAEPALGSEAFEPRSYGEPVELTEKLAFVEKSSASLINPVYRCDVRAPESDKYLARLKLPGRPEFGDTLVLFGEAYAIDSVSVNWSGIVDGGLHQPDLIPCELTLL